MELMEKRQLLQARTGLWEASQGTACASLPALPAQGVQRPGDADGSETSFC